MQSDDDSEAPSWYVRKKISGAALRKARNLIADFHENESKNRNQAKSVFIFIAIILAAILLFGFLIEMITKYLYYLLAEAKPSLPLHEVAKMRFSNPNIKSYKYALPIKALQTGSQTAAQFVCR